ncbi:MAG: 3-isopropylmalate dehydrogenase [bacterium]|nr:3-isopropylmalate dehydrogenase [bacterium]
MRGTIAVLAGDGIGPEIMASAVRILDAVNAKFGHTFETKEGVTGGVAYDKFGVHLPAETVEMCKKADAILFGAVGGPVSDQESTRWKDAEKNVILGLREKFNLFANLRPLKVWQGTESFSPLKPDLIAGMDVLIVRELIAGIYFGPMRRYEVDGEITAEETSRYTWKEIASVVRIAFVAAQKRRKKLTIVDKANVLETSRLWRDVTRFIHAEFPDIAMDFMFVDNAAQQLVRSPASFDVIATDNMFGDILSDLGGAVVGSLGLVPSASISAKVGSASGGNARRFGLYEPAHGSAPDIAGKNIANPTAQILSLAMLLRYTYDLDKEAQAIEEAVLSAWKAGKKTKDLAAKGEEILSTDDFTSCVIEQLQ